LNIRWIVIFAEVAADGSFIRAATRLNVAQPWLSAQIQRLEAECGVKLFKRINTGLELTPEGAELLPFAEQAARGARQFRDSARLMGDVRNKTVRIGSYLPMLQIPMLHRLNGSFAIRYSQYSIVVDNGPIEDMLGALANGSLDFVATVTPLPDQKSQHLDMIELAPVTPFLLLPRKSEIRSIDFLEGVSVAIPPVLHHRTFMEQLIEPLERRGAAIRNAPEPDKQALEHLVRAHGVAALMIQGDPDAYSTDPELRALPLPGSGAHHVLVRETGRGLARAAERYWTNARLKTDEAAGLMET
jgi:DNA-binding transcriptional LysR family regulator